MYYLKATKGNGTQENPIKTYYLTTDGSWTRNTDADNIAAWATKKTANKRMQKHGHALTFGRFDTITIEGSR